MAGRWALPNSLAGEILDDESGHALAVAAKALGLNRAAFSTLALLAQPGRDSTPAYAGAGCLRRDVGGRKPSRELRALDADAPARA